jgi:hypothetical protein
VNRALVRRIVSSLVDSGAPREMLAPLVALSRRRWEQVLSWLDVSGLTLTFWERIKKLDYEQIVPSEIRRRLEANLADNRQRVAEMAREFDAINRCLESAGAEYAVLKGFALAPEYCPDLGLRSFYDYDYFVPLASLETADRALRAAGYVRKKKNTEHHVTYSLSAVPKQIPASRDDLYSPNFGRTLELHHQLWTPREFKIPLSLPWHTSFAFRPRHWQGLRFQSVSEEDELLFYLLHTFRHILTNWCRLAWLLEIERFVEGRSQDMAFWQRFSERIGDNTRLADIVAVVLMLAGSVFRKSLPPAIQDLIRSRRPSLELWVERCGRESAFENFSGNKNCLLLYRQFVPDPEDWRAIRRFGLFACLRPSWMTQPSGLGAAIRERSRKRQAVYLARRLVHHSKSAMLYAWESYRCRRILSQGVEGKLSYR